MGIFKALHKDIPDVEPDKVHFGQVTKSATVNGYTLVMASRDLTKRDIPGYTEWQSLGFNY